MDNVQFNVRGEGYGDLLDTLKLAFRITEHNTAKGYKIIVDKGLVLYSSYVDDMEKFIVPMTAEELLPMVKAFINDYFTRNTHGIILSDEEWDSSAKDSDIDDYPGWRIYTEQWGEVNDEWQAFLAITPSNCWSSK